MVRVLEHFERRADQTPRVWFGNDQPLDEHFGDQRGQFATARVVRVAAVEDVKQRTAEILRMTVGVSELVYDGANQVIHRRGRKVFSQFHQNVRRRCTRLEGLVCLLTGCGHGEFSDM